MPKNKQIGDYGEQLALSYLNEKGYEVIKTNFKCRSGEIDIIARDKGYIVFIEVKLRTNLEKGYPREAVGRMKQKRIRKTALYWIMLNQAEPDVRFDVIEILMGPVTIEHIENAF